MWQHDIDDSRIVRLIQRHMEAGFAVSGVFSHIARLFQPLYDEGCCPDIIFHK
jgi:hypothetical protein